MFIIFRRLIKSQKKVVVGKAETLDECKIILKEHIKDLKTIETDSIIKEYGDVEIVDVGWGIFEPTKRIESQIIAEYTIEEIYDPDHVIYSEKEVLDEIKKKKKLKKMEKIEKTDKEILAKIYESYAKEEKYMYSRADTFTKLSPYGIETLLKWCNTHTNRSDILFLTGYLYHCILDYPYDHFMKYYIDAAKLGNIGAMEYIQSYGKRELWDYWKPIYNNAKKYHTRSFYKLI
ncbi:MAG: hypothetical protein Edafosvirus1_142 [Edafosvirus sp.]|uniref:Uncharacterized protein n=1 Tax=Edafosvirus sp. TaxID=2487765 RepID=A0A3G4ZUZ0_9VIRU|nr:MAG: hypothetical protein Edafosvirus1_142 [Edafosvirus sp.]